MVGRPRVPTHIKALQGTLHPERVNKDEPICEVGVPDKPDNLSEFADEIWDEVVPVLLNMGTLTRFDRLALIGLCNAYSDLMTAREQLAESGGSLTYETRSNNGYPMFRPRPEVGMIAEADKRYMIWLGRFGLTPADRSRVSVVPKEGTNPFESLDEDAPLMIDVEAAD